MLTMKLEETLGEGVRDAVVAGLTDFSRPHIGDNRRRPLNVIVRREDGSIAGGLIGETRWEWLYIDLLWVADDVRHQGWGTQMMQLADEEALRRGCCGIWLDTLDFQARGFYEKLGFTLFGTQDDYPPGHQRYFLQKRYPAR